MFKKILVFLMVVCMLLSCVLPTFGVTDHQGPNQPEKVEKPVISPEAGVYDSAQTVTITCPTQGATIHYVTNGTNPEKNSSVYTGPITISESSTIIAYAEKEGMKDSERATAAFIIHLPKVAAPAFSLAAGTYNTDQTVTLSCDTKGADIKYTLDGSAPSLLSETYTGPITISNTTTIKAYAVKNRAQYSETVTAEYIIEKRVAAPVFNPVSGEYNSIQMVELSCPTEGATVKYTTDGSTPNSQSAIYSEPITVSSTVTIKAFAEKSGMVNSDVVSAVYTINLPKVDMPVFSLAEGTYTGPQTLIISCGTEGAAIRYTTDGSTPDSDSDVYSGPITISSTETIKAYAVKAGMVDSDIATAQYTITTLPPPPPDFGPNVKIFDPSMDMAEISNTCTTIFSQMEANQFGSERYAFLFKPGTYNLPQKLKVGFYTQVSGLGLSPDDVTIGGALMGVDAKWMPNNNATCNFWRMAENLTVAGDMTWAVSQAVSLRRVHVTGNLALSDGGWSSGGFLADSKVDGTVTSGSQQQWFSRNANWGAWNGGNWNMVFVGALNAPAGNWTYDSTSKPYTTVEKTPVVREKPFLTIDDFGYYNVFVPSLKSDSSGTSWESGSTAGISIPISQFYIAHPETDTAATLNQALADGKNLLFTPGIYHLSEALQVANADTIILGLGLATLTPDNGNACMKIADVDGVKVAGLLFDAGATNSPVLMEVGPEGSSADHSANPSTLSDLFFRVGGAAVGKADVCITVNSNNVIGDNFWVWRADHGVDGSVGWTVNTTKNGIIVNGDDVTMYALMCEHFHQYQTIWNGNGGRTYFYQSECPYDVPSQAEYTNGTRNGYASYKIADSVTSHETWGLGIYSYFRDAAIKLDSAVEAPVSDNVILHNTCSVFLAGSGEITHVINNTGNTPKPGSIRAIVVEYPEDAKPKALAPVFSPNPGKYDSALAVSISCPTAGAQIRYTTDGSTPTAASALYTQPITVSVTSTVKAIGIKEGIKNSDVAEATYTVEIPANLWTEVWSDDFNDTSVDTSKWYLENKGDGFGNNEAQYYSPGNAKIENGNLIIQAEKVTPSAATNNLSYTSAKLMTVGKADWKYGKFEARMKLPLGQGFWPAFWMMPADGVYGGWAASGEVDIMEAKGRIPNVIGGTLHYGGAWPGNKYTGANYNFPAGESIDGYHTYSVEWEPGEFRWYVDGILYQTQNNWNTYGANGEEKYAFPAPFDQDFYLIMNLAIGGNFDGGLMPPDGLFPAQMAVDYVKVYELTGRDYKTPKEPGTAVEPMPAGARVPDATGNQVYDVNYEQGIKDNPEGVDANFGEYWNFIHNAGFGGVATATVDNVNGTNFAKIDVSNKGTQPYSVQLEQHITLGKGRWYKFAFDAKADKARTLAADIGGGSTVGWAKYSNSYTANLTTDVKHFEYVFQMTRDSDILTRIEFNCATDTGPVWIGNVRVQEVDPPVADYSAPKEPLPVTGNLVYNGAFDKYTISRMAYWNAKTNGADAAIGVPENTRELTVDIANGGTAADAITVDQKGLKLVANSGYKLSFKARSTADRTIKVKVVNKDGTVTYLPEQTINLTTSMKSFDVSFKMGTVSDPESQLVFLLGGNNSDVFIDDVLFVKTSIDYSGIDMYPLKNGDFSAGIDPWTKWNGEGGNATASVVDGEAKVSVAAVGNQTWSIQFCQDNMNFTKGMEYVFSFDARSSVDRNIEYTIENAAYTRRSTAVIGVGPVTRHFSYTFTAPTDEKMSLKFLLGKTDAAAAALGTHDIFIDNVVLEVKDAKFLLSPIVNGQFNAGIDPWTKWTGDGGAADMSVVDGELKVAVSGIGANSWSVQAYQEGFKLENGQTYRLSFKARADAARKMNVNIGKALTADPWFTAYMPMKTPDLTSEMKEYTYDFTVTQPTYDKLKIVFEIGNVAGGNAATNVYIDDVAINKVVAPLEKVAAPVITPAGGAFLGEQAVTISCATVGAVIRYTIDGSTPTAVSPVYSTPLTVTADTTIKAYASKAGMADTDVVTATFNKSHEFTNGTFDINTDGWKLYKNDGSNAAMSVEDGKLKVNFPNYDGWFVWSTQVYQDFIKLDANKTYKLSFDISSAFSKPVQVSLEKGSDSSVKYVANQTLNLTADTKAYSFEFTTGDTAVLDAKLVFLLGSNNVPGENFITHSIYIDNVVLAQKVVEKVAMPAFSPAAGNYASAQTVSISCATAGAEIRYTTDGTEPNSGSALYTSPISVSSTATIKAIALKGGMLNSDVASAMYTIVITPYNLALNRPAAASTSLGGNTPAMAVDGATGTRWESVQGADPQWFSVDIGASIVTGVTLRWETAAGRDYKVQVSNDNVTWTDIYTKTGGTNGAVEVVTLISPVSAEFVRMYGTARTTAYGYSLWEFEVYGTPDTGKTAKPVITPAAGTYTSQTTVAITDSTPGAEIRYTTDGSAPTETNGTVYAGPFILKSSATVKAVAYKAGLTISNPAVSAFTVVPLGTPSGITKATSTDTSITLSWSSVTGAAGYNIRRALSAYGEYTKLNASPVTVLRYKDEGLTTGTTYYYKISAVNEYEESPLSAPFTADAVQSTEPDFGQYVKIFDPGMSMTDISNTCTAIFNQMERNQFGNERYAILFKPGTYNLTQTLRVGFYTEVSGLGQSPDDVTIGGSLIGVDAGWFAGNATQNFWRSIENLSVAGNMKWAVSQATSLRRVHVKGNLRLADGGWSSGGFLADSLVDGSVSSESQQQWLSRNTNWGSWGGGVWNMVFVGVNNAPAGTWPDQPYTTVDKTPIVREKPYLTIDSSGKYSVFVPALKSDSKGTSWSSGPSAGESISIDKFYIAHPESDTAATLNAALAVGKHLLLTPGVYHLSEALQVNNANTVILGMGLATLIPDNGNACMKIADVDGVIVAGLLFDAGETNSQVLLEVGPDGSSAAHSANPTCLSDLFFRVGGAAVGKADTCVIVNSDNVIGDNFWVWRADHSNGVGWNVNTTKNGIIVNGDNVTMYALMSEHFHQYCTVWNGNGGRTYFYQSEWAYDVPDQASWMNGSVNGYASYKIADSVTSHEAWGLGMYSFFRDAVIKVNSAMEAPVTPNVKIHNICSVFLSGNGEVTHVINDFGNTAKAGTIKQIITEFPGSYMPKAAAPVFNPVAGTYESVQTVTISTATDGATIRYTTDSSTPIASSAAYTGTPITIGQTTTLKAVAFKDGFAPSDVTTVLYTINILPPNTVAAPRFTPPAGSYSTPQQVAITSDTSGASIKYTLDGSIPNASSTVYSEPITVSENTTIKAYATKDGMTDSAVTTAGYTFKPDFGPNVIIFDPSMPIDEVSNTGVSIFNKMETNQFGNDRYAILFKPGTYNLTQTLRIGFYTQVAGLGRNPDDVVIGGSRLGVDAGWMSGNATQNFWRSLENIAVNGDTKWAVAQAAPMRRVHIKGNLTLSDGGYSSGGFIADSLIDGTVTSGSQQQWLSRNSKWGTWNGGVWNMVFVGDDNAPTTTWPSNPYTTVTQTPVEREKPYLYVDNSDKYFVFVPSTKTNASGITWAGGSTPGTSIPIEQFYIARSDRDTAASINAALTSGKHLLFTPGVYNLDAAINVNNPNTIILGLGFATLRTVNGNRALNIADVDGVTVSGLTFDAGEANSDVLMEVGPAGGSTANHSANPTFLSDLFFRVGGSGVGKADNCLIINSNNVIGDFFWIWRADHGDGIGWNVNTTKNGLVVNGNDVAIYGLMSEHFHQYQVLWNGQGGRVYFYQSEWAYDIPDQASWMDGTKNGYTSYKIADTVTTHEAWGLGIYSYFRDAVVKVDSAVEAPVTPNVKIHNTCSVFLTGNGEITHVINGYGNTALAGNVRQIITEWPAAAMPTVAAPVFTPAPGTYTAAQTVSMSCQTTGAAIHYTTNGSTPNASSPVYSTPLTVAATTTIKAYAVKAGLNDSPVTTGVYTINISQPTTTLYPGNTAVSGVTPAGLNITNVAPTGGGWTPTKSVSTTPLYWYSNVLTGSYAAGNWAFILWTNSPIAPVTSSIVEVSLYVVNTDGSGAVQIGTSQTKDIKTTGGGNHTSTFNFNAIPTINFSNQRLMIKVVRVGGDGNCTMAYWTKDFLTRLTTPVYTDSGNVAAPTFSPAAGTYTSVQTVTISSATTDAVIRYTTDGSTPSVSSTVYSGPITVGANTTIKAYASKTGQSDSAVVSSVYVINLPLPPAAVPTFSPAGGTYPEAQNVTLSSATDGANIYYTLDGSTPTSSSALYTAAIPVTQSVTIKAVAIKAGFSNSSVATAVYTIGADPWTLVWSDEFDGSTVDTTKWNFENAGTGFGNNEAQYYRTENATVENGSLVINGRKEAYGGRNYTSAKLMSKENVKYGKIEASIKLPLGQGFWPAFWMMPTNAVYGGWAASGELDIMEAKGRLPGNVGGTAHFGGAWPNNIYDSTNYYFPSGQDISGFHTYALEWEPGELRWYVDGNLYKTLTNWYTKGANGEEKYAFPAPFDQDFYLILNLAIGGTFDGGLLPPDNLFPDNSKMYVDYVRVYDLTGRPYKTPVEPGTTITPLPAGARQPDATGNLVADMNFAQGIKDNAEGVDANFGDQWNFVHNAQFGATAAASVDNINSKNYAKIDVTNKGSQPYAVQLEQLTTLGTGRWYKFSYDAKADRNRTIVTDLSGGPTAGWTKYSESYTSNLTANFQHFENVFQMTKNSDILTRIEFNCATDIGTVWIGNVRVEETVPPTQNGDASKNPLPTSGNYIYNGAFDKYTIDRMAYWNVVNTGADATVKVPESTRELTALITDGGSSADALIVNQKGVQLTKGFNYKLSFKARAEAARTIKVRFANKAGSTLYQPDQEIALTTAISTKEVLFSMTADTDLESQLAFLLGGSNADVFIDDVLLVKTSVSYTDIAPNPLQNGDFSQGLASWGSWIGEGGGGTVSVVNGEARIAVTAAGNQTYSLQFYQPGLIMGNGYQYKVAFDARSTKARNIELSIENAAYTRYFTTVIAVGTTMTHYEYTFTMPASDEMTYKFLLGKTDAVVPGLGAHEIYIDNVVCQVAAAPLEPAAVPTFSPAPGTFDTAQTVAISCATADAAIRYTIDGSEPNSGSPLYNGALTVSATTVVKAYASKAGMADSAVATAAYNIIPPYTAGTVRLTDSTVTYDHFGYTLNANNSINTVDKNNIVATVYPTKVIENDYLKVTLLPEFGGRILSIIYKPTGHDLLFQNPVGTPYGIGEGNFYYNWLMVYGGIFPTFPEAEHGKTWLLPWDYRVVEQNSDKVSVEMSLTDNIAPSSSTPGKFNNGQTGIKCVATVTVYKDKSYVDLGIKLINTKNQTVNYEYWTGATMAPGSAPGNTTLARNSELVVPIDKVHSRSDWWPWMGTVDQPTGDGAGIYKYDNLADFSNWADMGIAYAYPKVDKGWWGVINHDNEEGIFRIADNNTYTPGLKFWTWGADRSYSANPQNYADIARPYVEMWAGNTIEYYQDATLAVGQEKSWIESYIPTVGLSKITYANKDAAVSMSFTTDAGTGEVSFNADVFTTHPNEQLKAVFKLGGSENVTLGETTFTSDPLKANKVSITKAGTDISAGSHIYVLEIQSASGEVLAHAEIPA